MCLNTSHDLHQPTSKKLSTYKFQQVKSSNAVVRQQAALFLKLMINQCWTTKSGSFFSDSKDKENLVTNYQQTETSMNDQDKSFLKENIFSALDSAVQLAGD